ncbi:MAG TPA: ATP-binding protein [Kofleriaceae bacterium]
MSERRPANLRNVLSFAAVLVTLLATTAALSLVLATSVLQRMTADIAASVESVRTIEEAEVALLLHARSTDPAQRRTFATQLHQLLGEAQSAIGTPQEAKILGEANAEVDRYLDLVALGNADQQELKLHESRAIDALERLGDLDVAQTRAAHDRAIRWDRIANIAGIVLGVSIVAITAALVLWLRRRVIRPLFALADTMKRFGDGERALRAAERGPKELRDMTHSFNEMADSIAAQRQAQTAFLGGVAHDLRNPLSALKLAVQMFDLKEPLPPEPLLRRTLAVIGRQIEQLERMVGDFLDMAKIEAGTLELTIDHHDIRAIVNGSVELFETSRSRFRITTPDEPLIVGCDAVRIGQAITNLISNAIKYSPPEEPIDIIVTATPQHVAIEVVDRGVGIPRGDHQRIFEPFQRGATRSTVPGTGLGLYNVQRIVEAHGGRIEVDSVPAVGSTFRICLDR